MTAQQGKGVQVLSQLVKDLSRLDPTGARAIIDGLSDNEIADVLFVSAAASAATGEGDEFTESVATRLFSVEAEVRQ